MTVEEFESLKPGDEFWVVQYSPDDAVPFLARMTRRNLIGCYIEASVSFQDGAPKTDVMIGVGFVDGMHLKESDAWEWHIRRAETKLREAIAAKDAAERECHALEARVRHLREKGR